MTDIVIYHHGQDLANINHPGGLEDAIVVPARLTLGDRLGDPVVLAQEDGVERGISHRGAGPVQPGRIEIVAAFRLGQGIIGLLVNGCLPKRRAAGAQEGQTDLLCFVEELRIEFPVLVEEKRILLVVELSRFQPAIMSFPQGPGARLIEAVNLAQVDLVVRGVAARVQRMLAQETVCEPLGEVAEQDARALAGLYRALPHQQAEDLFEVGI